MKIQAPFQGSEEHAGQGFDGRRSYILIRFVLRAFIPSYDCEGVPRIWRRPFVWQSEPVRKY
jgi:hypothetical protein